MKTRIVVLGCLAGAVVLFCGHEYSSAQLKTDALSSKVGIVSISTVFRDCKTNASYRRKAIAEQEKIIAKLELLQKQSAALEAGLKALKPGSSDHLKQYEELLKKQAEFEAMKQFSGRRRVIKDAQWTEVLYKEVLRITKELAKQKGLTMVLEVTEPEFPMVNSEELSMVLQTHKVLYSAGCVDLTAEVVAEMDKIESKFKL